MKKTIAIAIIILIQMTGCVQKTYKKTVVYNLNVAGISNVKNVGMRGKDQPLNWQSDLAMKMNPVDSTYQAVVTYVTGYKFTEAKFVVNNEFELQDQDNRRIVFAEGDTTVYQATFNVKK